MRRRRRARSVGRRRGMPSGRAVPISSTSMDDLLASVFSSIWTELSSAASDRRHGFHVGTVATVAEDGSPRARSVVLRGVDAERGALRFHTDIRSPKVGEIACRPRVAWHFYAPERTLQVRLLGVAHCAASGAATDLAWSESPLSSRRCYLAPAAPGAVAPGPSPNLPEAVRGRRPTEAESEAGRGRFSTVVTIVSEIDWLSLASGGHRRARFERKPGHGRVESGAGWTGCWIEP